MPHELSERALDLLEDLPPFLQGAYDTQGVIDALARELDRVEDALENVRDNFFPQRGEDYLAVWESLLGLAVNPADKTTEQRRTSILAFMQSMKSAGSGLTWQENLTALIGTGWTYEEHDPNDAGSPEPYTLRISIPFSPPIDVPSGVTATSVRLTNLVTNPSAENNLTDGSQFINANTSGLTSVTFERSNAWAKSGSWSVRNKGTNPDTTARSVSTRTNQVLPFVGGKRYFVAVEVNFTDLPASTNYSSNPRLNLVPHDGVAGMSSINVMTLTAAEVNAGPHERRFYGYVTAPATSQTCYMRVFATINQPVTVGFHVDSLMCVEVPAGWNESQPIPYFDGDTATYEWAGAAHNSVSRRDGPLRYYRVTALNSYGETTASADASAELASDGSVTVSWAAVPGATGYRVYRGSSPNPTFLIATVLGGSTVTYSDANASAGMEQPPTVNSTQSTQAHEAEQLARQITPAHLDLIFGYGQGFLVGISQVGEEFL